MRVAFFGTPEFAVPSLRALLEEGFEVTVVVTQPDRPQGRSRSTLVPPPVKVVALEEDIPVLQPAKPVGPFLDEFRAFDVDIAAVVAYGHILRPDLLAIPRLGMINVHASILPALRGAAPIQWSILNGDETTGISIIQLEAGLDAGPVLHTLQTEVAADETGGELTERLAELGAAALIEALTLIDGGEANPVPQDHAQATFAPKVNRQTARLDWSRDAASVARVIRAFDPEPGAWCLLDGAEVKLFGARAANGSGEPGTVIQSGATITVAAAVGAVEISEIQPAGKKRMSVGDWTRGRNSASLRFT